VPLSRSQRRRIADLARGRGEEPLRVLEGPKAVLDALPLGAVTEVWASTDLEPAALGTLGEAARRAGLALHEAAPADLARVSETVTPQGVLALVKDTAEPLERLALRPGLLVWLDGVQDPGNVGAVVRAAAGLGAAGLLVGTGTADPLGLKALRASAGLALRVPFARAAGPAVAAALAAAGREVWLLEKGGRDVFTVERTPRDLVLVLGSEGSGPSAVARAAARGSVGVVVRPEVESLNAAVAMGIVLSVLARRLPAAP
jgi:TrmH family RNA methyltransferase